MSSPSAITVPTYHLCGDFGTPSPLKPQFPSLQNRDDDSPWLTWKGFSASAPQPFGLDHSVQGYVLRCQQLSGIRVSTHKTQIAATLGCYD